MDPNRRADGAERGYEPLRPTTDADAVVNAREPAVLGEITASLVDLGLSAQPSADGVQHRWTREQAVEVQVGSRVGMVRRPDLLSAMILKAAARTETNGSGLERHCLDFAALAAMMAASDATAFDLKPKDKRRLGKMIKLTRESIEAMEQNPTAARRLGPNARLSAAIDIQAR